MQKRWPSLLFLGLLCFAVLTACNSGPTQFPTDTPEPTVKPTVPAFTPPPNAKFRIGQQVVLVSKSFVVVMADEPRSLDGPGPTETCFTNVTPTILAIEVKSSVIYYLLDCNGLSQGWLPEFLLAPLPR